MKQVFEKALDLHCDECDLIVFSHLRWDFVFQRPQHLMSRYARHRRVYFFEEPVFDDSLTAHIHISERTGNLKVVVPHIPKGSEDRTVELLKCLVDRLMLEEWIDDYSVWYYTPMALNFTDHLEPRTTIYDCMDELSHFKGAPPELIQREKELFHKADVVFTGGQTLYEAKKKQHSNIHAFPSSIDSHHFAQARGSQIEPEDQAPIAGPRIGFFGVIDERMDLDLLDQVATLRPDWQLVILGPVVKIDPSALPNRSNIHYLGKKEYADLPRYLSGWDVAMLPFALNESTKFISPTKTPEYLAAGRPVVSTPIRDVVYPYGQEKLVHIATTADEFVAAVELALQDKKNAEWRRRVDHFLADMSWDSTWSRMAHLEYQSSRKVSSLPLESETGIESVPVGASARYV